MYRHIAKLSIFLFSVHSEIFIPQILDLDGEINFAEVDFSYNFNQEFSLRNDAFEAGSGFTDPCEMNNCNNNSICIPNFSSDTYGCLCESEFYGDFCDSNYNDCLVEPCGPGGVCDDGVRLNLGEMKFDCQCQNGYELVSEVCIEIDECEVNACINPPLCTDFVNDYGCGIIVEAGFSCSYGWEGKNCDEPFDFCESGPWRRVQI